MTRFPTIGAALAMLVAMFAGCSEAVEREAVPAQEARLAEHTPLANGMVLPAGTTIYDAVTEDGSPTLRFKLPEGMLMLGRTEDGVLLREEEGGIRCTCTEGTGDCTPFKVTLPGGNTSVGCALQDNCTVCEARATAAIQQPDGALHIIPLEDADLVNPAQGINFVGSLDELDSVRCLRRVTAGDPAFQQAVQAFAKAEQSAPPEAFKPNAPLPPGHRRIAVNAWGKLLVMPVRSTRLSFLANEAFMPRVQTAIDEGNTRCRCISGSSGCTYQRAGGLGVGVEWCEADACQSCQMNF